MIRTSYKEALLHATMLTLAFVVVGHDLVLMSATIFGSVGVLFGVFASYVVGRLRIRLWVSIVGSWLVGLLFIGLATINAQYQWGTELVGLEAALAVSNSLSLMGTMFAIVFTIRILTMRYRALLTLEAIAIGSAVALPVLAHRDGMIARPLSVADWFWQQGIDPVYAFLALGSLGSILMAGVLAKGRNSAKVGLQLGGVAALAGLLSFPLHCQAPADTFSFTQPSKGASSPTETESEKEQSKNQRPRTAEDNLEEQQKGDGGPKRPVAIVLFHKNVDPLGGVFYFRHAAFSQFNGVRLVESTERSTDEDVYWRFPSKKTVISEGPLEPIGRSIVSTDVALLTDHQRLFALINPIELHPLANPAPGRFKRAYRVIANVANGAIDQLLGQNAGKPEWDDRVWDHYTSIPEDPRYFELAARLDATILDEFRQDPLARALVIKEYLEETTIYSFTHRYEGKDPTAEFLFSSEEDRKGYCTHLAHSAAMLLRALNIPARVSVGYAVAAQNLRGGSSLLIRGGDAHAWVEIYLDETGWVPIEIVPDRKESEPQPFQEEDLQRLLGEMARGEGKTELEADTPNQYLQFIRKALSNAPWLLVVGLIFAYLRKVFRGWLPMLKPKAIRPAYIASLDRLAAHGILRRYGESREAFAVRVSTNAPSFLELTSQLGRAGLGRSSSQTLATQPSQPPSHAAVDHGISAYRLSKSFARELADGTPWWLRLLAFVHPAPWWWAK